MAKKMIPISKEQKDILIKQEFDIDSYFNPIQDENEDWFISKEEARDVKRSKFLFIKNLPTKDFTSKEDRNPKIK